jgi:hypothetical protein
MKNVSNGPCVYTRAGASVHLQILATVNKSALALSFLSLKRYHDQQLNYELKIHTS